MKRPPNLSLYAGMLPAFFIVVFAYLVTLLWTVGLSFTDSKMFPVWTFFGTAQYERLFATTRWQVSLVNLGIVAVLLIGGALVIGILLAIAIDQKVRAEGLLRTFILYPFAMSFVVTGVAWGWLLNPELGIQRAMRNLGWTSFTFDWLIHAETAIYCVVLAGVWHSAGLVMVVILAGLRGIDQEMWKAMRVDGVPAWRGYLHVVIPMLGPSVASVAVLLSLSVIKLYDLVLVLTSGGPGGASEVPAKFVMDYLFNRQNIGLASAAATVLLAIVLVVFILSRLFQRGARSLAVAR